MNELVTQKNSTNFMHVTNLGLIFSTIYVSLRSTSVISEENWE